MNRKLLPAALTLGVVAAGLLGCAGQNTAADSAACTPTATPGAVSESLKLQRDAKLPATLGGKGTVTVTATQRSVVSPAAAATAAEAQAEPITPGRIVVLDLTLYDSSTGARVYQTADNPNGTGSDFLDVYTELGKSPLADVVRCAVPGERLTAVFPAAESEVFAQQFGVSPGAATIAVIDVKSAGPGYKAAGSEQRLPSGFPAVTRAAGGEPGVVLPPTGVPGKLQVAVRIAGTGNKVTATDSLIVQYTNIGWHGQVTSSSWGAGPQLLSDEATESIVWRNKLTGLKVGSQVVVLTPETDGIEPTVTVLDIIAAG